MPGRLRFLVCRPFLAETRAVLREEGFERASVATYAVQPECRPIPEKELLSATLSDACPGRKTVVLGSVCLANAPPSSATREFRRLEFCFERLINVEFIAGEVRRGAYFVTPGWLAHWRRRVRDWGFTKATAREFFGDCARKIVLLDTGLDVRTPRRGRDFAAFVGLPFEEVAVGLSHYRLFLREIYLDWDRERVLSESKEQLAGSGMRIADYEMIFDMINDLARLREEGQVIERTLELLMTLFSPARLEYVALEDGAVRQRYTWSPEAAPALDGGWMELLKDAPWSETDDGFALKIAYRNETVAMVRLGGFAFPEYARRYFLEALSLSQVCSLAIANARAFRQLDLVNQELKGFAHTVSHDLRSPLTNIKLANGLIQEILKQPEEERNLTDLAVLSDVMERSVQSAIALIGNILALAQAGQVPQSPGTVDVELVVKTILYEKAEALRERGVCVETDGALGTVVAEPTHVYQIFANLVGNAVRYGACDSPVIRIARLCDGRPGYHRFLVCDNGPGIPEGLLDKIFRPFVKGKGGENGLGLSIVERILRVYGGEIRAYNDAGACFELAMRDWVPVG